MDILDQGEEQTNDAQVGARQRVVSKALSILSKIHHALSQESVASMSLDVLQDLKCRRVIDGLLDLVSLEGIYPSLSLGVGIPIERRVRSVLQGGIVTRTSSAEESQGAKDKELLVKITENLNQIAESKVVGLRSALRERTLVDLVAGLGELAYNPSYAHEDSSSSHAARLKILLDAYVSRSI